MTNLALPLGIGAITVGTVWTVYTNIVTVSSHLHSLLPPWDNEALACYPGFQKAYRLCIYFLGYAGGSYRSTVYSSISTKEGSQISAASATATATAIDKAIEAANK